jgi:hypothetical protein
MNESPPPARNHRVTALLVGGVLLLPLLALSVVRVSEAPVFIALIGAPVLSLIGGIVLGIHLGRSVPAKIVLAILLPVLLLIGSETLLWIGCSTGHMMAYRG